ncbi:MAG: hypothetical protein ILO53_05135 [Clostridia bacterium]|nr:hypothetical protein [Clostridia bacterium]
MSNLKLAVAVMDIGTTGVRILVGRITENGTPKIIAKAETSFAGAVDLSGDVAATDLSKSIANAVDTVYNKTGIEIKSCYVSISNKYVRSIFSTGDIFIMPPAAVTGLNVGEVLNEASAVNFDDDETLVDIIPVAYTADGVRLHDKPEGTICNNLHLDANVVVAKAAITDKVTRILADLDIKTDGFVPSFFASQKVFDASAFFTGKRDGCFTVIADVGGAVTDISVFYNGIPFAFGAVNMGGNNISRDIEKVLSVSANQAVRLKQDYAFASKDVLSGNIEIPMDRLDATEGNMIEVSYLAEIMNARIVEIAQKTLTKVNSLMQESGIQKPVIDKLYFIGDGIVHFRGINDALGSAIKVNGDVEALDKGKDLGIKTSFTTALGMLIYISSKIKYGRRPSTVINRNETDNKPGAEAAVAEKESFGTKVKNFFAGIWESVKGFFERLKS